MNRLKQENYVLKQNNYYLVCTIQQLEKQKLKIVNQDIDEISEIILEDTREYDNLHNQIQIIDISCGIPAETLENKINELEKQKGELTTKLKLEQSENKEEIERLNNENDALHNNNAQLQFELIKILKNKQKMILEN